MKEPDITIMIPALNESSKLEATVIGTLDVFKQVPSLTCEIIIVNDSSSDETPLIADRLAQQYEMVQVIHHSKQKGLGNSFKEVVKIARGRKFLIVPGDGDLASNTVRILLQNAGKADLVASYFLNNERRGRMRNIISAVFGLIYYSVFNVFLQYINGPCIYPTAKLRELDLISSRFSIVAEINVKLLRQGLSFLEVPGYKQTGNSGSMSLSFLSLIEVCIIFFRLFWKVNFSEKKRFNQKAVRIQPEFTIDLSQNENTILPNRQVIHGN